MRWTIAVASAHALQLRLVLVMAMFQNVDLQLHGLDLVVVLGHNVLLMKVMDVRRGW